MAPDPVIQQYAQRTNVEVIWGAEYLLTDLDTAARRVGINHPPRANHIRNEVRAVTVGANADEGSRSGKPRSKADIAPPVEQMELSATTINITIHHLEQMIVPPARAPMPELRLVARAFPRAAGKLPAAPSRLTGVAAECRERFRNPGRVPPP